MKYNHIWVAWDTGMDHNIGASFRLSHLKEKLEDKYDWCDEWSIDEDENWTRDHGLVYCVESIIIEKCPYYPDQQSDSERHMRNMFEDME